MALDNRVEELEKKLEEQRHEIWELQDLTEYLKDKLKESERDRGVLVERVKELSTEYIVLLEKYRWRKQALDPVPINIPYEETLVYIARTGGVGFMDCEGLCPDDYWRPVDRPETGHNEK